MKVDKINIYLDLDETLIYSYGPRSGKKLNLQTIKPTPINFENAYYIVQRPGLQTFLDWLFKNFNVSIWSAASPDYVRFIVDHIIIGKDLNRCKKLQRVLDSDYCEKSQKIYGDDCLKKLAMLWDYYKLPNHNENNTILLDDLGLNIKAQPENSIRIKKFQGEQNDNELIKVKKKLENILNNFKVKKKIDKSPHRPKKINL
jgi:TFIIF-interacting CTD phosphatase-like protein